MMTNTPKPQLTYFKLRGYAQFPRVVMSYLGVDYDDVYVDKIDDELRKDLKFDQLPLFHDVDGFKLNQSLAITKLIAEKKDFIGKTLKERSLVVEAVACVHTDIVMPAMRAAAGLEDRKRILDVVIPRYFGAFEKVLSQNKFIACGDHYTIADLYVYVAYDYLGHLGFDQEHLHGKFPNLDSLKKYFESTNGIKRYLATRPETDRDFYKNMCTKK